MANIIGTALLSHVPTIMLPENVRLELNEGKEISFIPGFKKFRAEVMDVLKPKTIIVIDTHWFTTIEFIITAHEKREGLYTSEELPRGMKQVPYHLKGNNKLAHDIANEGVNAGVPFIANDDPYLPIHYPTINIAHFIEKGEEWLSVSIPQTAEKEDFIVAGHAIKTAIEKYNYQDVMIFASGGLSHRFWPLKDIAKHEASDPIHVRTPEAREADKKIIDYMKKGKHNDIYEFLDEYSQFKPEGKFGHYIMMAEALGGKDAIAKGVQYSDYENATGTGQVHMYFPVL